MKRIASLLAIIFLAISLSSCREDDGAGYIFSMDIAENPDTLDPQIAGDYSSLLIISNMYVGLLTEQNDGTIGEGVAESYEVSEDGLVYTFELKNTYYWVDNDEFEAPCTANDFVFAFQRLFNPQTQAPKAADFFIIKNSKAINQGLITDFSKLGVYADGDYRLIIKLETPNPALPQLLTTAAALPCNEEFFYKSQGKYGLRSETTAANGAFYISQWQYDQWGENNNIILRRNDKYTENATVYPYGLNFLIDDGVAFDNFKNGSTDSYAASGAEAEQLLQGKFKSEKYVNSTIGFMFNLKEEPFSNEAFRLALMYATDRELFAQSLDGYDTASAIIPPEVKILNQNYRETADGEIAPAYSLSKAQSLMKTALQELDRDYLNSLTLIVPDDVEIKENISYILQQWQKDLGFFCKVEALSDAQLESRIKSGDYSFAITKLGSDYNSPKAFLSRFLTGNSQNYTGFKSAEFKELLDGAEQADSLSESAELYRKAEAEVLSKAVFIPLFYRSEYFFYNMDCADISYNPFSGIVIYKDAKEFS